jgi:hypothetical protein
MCYQCSFKYALIHFHTLQNYLGHSINAPTGRWQKNKDVHWYGRDLKSEEVERAEEIRKIKEAEAEALSVALYVTLTSYVFLPVRVFFSFDYRGFGPAQKTLAGADASPSASTAGGALKTSPSDTQRNQEKEARRQRKAERKEEKRARKERRRAERVVHDDHDYDHSRPHRRDRSRSRSRSPRRRTRDEDFDNFHYSRRPRTRSISPPRQRRSRSRDRLSYNGSRREQDWGSDRRRRD